MLGIVAVVAADSTVVGKVGKSDFSRFLDCGFAPEEAYLSAVAASHFHLRFDWTPVAVVPCACVQGQFQ